MTNKLTAAAFAVLATLSVASAQVERPATIEPGMPPGTGRDGEGPPPEDGRIERNGMVLDTFAGEGQVVDYAFAAEAGELSVFELDTWGYSRGWASALTLEIVDASGAVLSTTGRPGNAVYTEFHCFTAPAAGEYAARITATENYFRYRLVRHSEYLPRVVEDPKPIGESELLHGYLATSDDRVAYSIELAEGEEIGFQVLPTHKRWREQARATRHQNLTGDGVGSRRSMGAGGERGGDDRGANERGAGERGENERGSGERGGGDRGANERGAGERGAESPRPQHDERARPSFATPQVQVFLGTEPLTTRGHYARFRAPSAGCYTVLVSGEGRSEGGLFDLAIERATAKVSLGGYVGDHDDDPVAGVRLRFFREPELDPLATVESSADGEFVADLPGGDYLVLLDRGAGTPTTRLRTLVEEGAELNAIYTD